MSDYRGFALLATTEAAQMGRFPVEVAGQSEDGWFSAAHGRVTGRQVPGDRCLTSDGVSIFSSKCL